MAKDKKSKQKKIPLTSSQKKARWGLAGCIIGILLLNTLIVLALVAMFNNETVIALEELPKQFNKVEYTEKAQLQPQKDTDGYWTFVTDEDFKIVQITDVHIGGGSFSAKKDVWAMNAVAAMVSVEKPDLVVVTGDIAFPVLYSSGSFNNLNPTKIFANMMESLGVYWTFAFGNHDTEVYSRYTRKELSDFYTNSGFQYCLYQEGDEKVDGYGNTVIKVKNTQGIVTQAIFTFDSHSYTDGDYLGILWKYDNIHQNQVDWYKNEILNINQNNASLGGGDVKSMAFFHIPLREYRTAWSEYVNNGCKDTEDVTYVYGDSSESTGVNSMGEETYGVYCGVGDDQLFETGAQLGLQAIFCGHDHYNNFSIEYKGIRLTYGMSIDYLAMPGIWKKKSQRGCTIITVSPDGSFDCQKSWYYQTDANGQEKYAAQNKQ